MRKLLVVAAFAIGFPIILVSSIIFIAYLSFHKEGTQGLLSETAKSSVAYAALPAMASLTTGEITQVDQRVEKVQNFFARYASPLEPFAQNIVSEAIENNLDYRLLPAIAMQESNLCKKAPVDSFNCWGFAIYGTKKKAFDNYESAISAVSKTLAEKYIALGLDTPEKIASKYTPSDDGTWVKSVIYFMNAL